MPTRREFFKSTALFGSLPALPALSALVDGAPPEEAPSSPAEYTLPELPYTPRSLEPYIDAATMRVHHQKFHAQHTQGLNQALKKLEQARSSGDYSDIQSLSRALAFHAAGYVNHTIFWHNMAPKSRGGGGIPQGRLELRLQQDFGSVAQFKAHFTAAAGQIEGNGWAVLGYHPVLQRLVTTQMLSNQNLNTVGLIPLLMIDVWEHAYYLQHRYRRNEYIAQWWNVVNWYNVAERYEQALAGRNLAL